MPQNRQYGHKTTLAPPHPVPDLTHEVLNPLLFKLIPPGRVLEKRAKKRFMETGFREQKLIQKIWEKAHLLH